MLPHTLNMLQTLHLRTPWSKRAQEAATLHHTLPHERPVDKPRYPPARFPRLIAHLQECQQSADDGRDEAAEDGPRLGAVAVPALGVERRDGVQLLSRNETNRRDGWREGEEGGIQRSTPSKTEGSTRRLFDRIIGVAGHGSAGVTPVRW